MCTYRILLCACTNVSLSSRRPRCVVRFENRCSEETFAAFVGQRLLCLLLSASLSLLLSSECPVQHLLLSDSAGQQGQATTATEKNSLLLNTFLNPILGLIILGNVRVAEIFRGFNLIEICRLVKYKFQHKWPTLTLVKAEVLCWIFIRERHYNLNCILYLVHDSFNTLSCCHFPPFLQSRQLWIIVICEGYEVALNSLRVFPWRIRKLQNVCSRLTPQDLF